MNKNEAFSRVVIDAQLAALGWNVQDPNSVAVPARLRSMEGKEAPHGVNFPISEINHAMLVFVVGVGLAGLATGVRYLTQLTYSLDRQKIGNRLNLLSNLLATGSFAAFFGGGYMAFLALGA